MGAKVQISADGGWSPRWSGDGRELFYRDGKNLMVVPIDTGNGFSAGRPEALFEDSVPAWMDGGYDVSADGQRFLTMETLPDGANKIVFVPHWFEELKRLVPTGN